MSVPLYRRLLGERYDALPRAVAELHDVGATRIWRGEGTVERGRSLLARIAATVASLPPATGGGAPVPVSVTFTPDDRGGETWSRAFGARSERGRPFVSYQFAEGGCLQERVRGARFVFSLAADGDGLRLGLESFHVLGIPVPRVLEPRIRTFEWEVDGLYHFEVEAGLPLGLGLLVRYSGWLKPG